MKSRLTEAFSGDREPVVFHNTHYVHKRATGHCPIQKAADRSKAFGILRVVLGPSLTGVGWLIPKHSGQMENQMGLGGRVRCSRHFF